jgi:hypothetical protein
MTTTEGKPSTDTGRWAAWTAFVMEGVGHVALLPAAGILGALMYATHRGDAPPIGLVAAVVAVTVIGSASSFLAPVVRAVGLRRR